MQMDEVLGHSGLDKDDRRTLIVAGFWECFACGSAQIYCIVLSISTYRCRKQLLDEPRMVMEMVRIPAGNT
jgi:hypothetical protein